jgi:protein-tyrosine phosphatase
LICAPPRAIPLEGASNLRDLGGWPAAGGRRVRRGQVFRSASLARLTVADHLTLAQLGLRSIVDLRSTGEQARLPDRIGGLAVMHLALPLEAAPGFDLAALLASPATSEATFLDAMRQAYQAYALECCAHYARLFALLLDPARRPLLFHCTAGKDRTGVAAALLLAALGAHPQAIEADYLATNQSWRGEPEFTEGLPPNARILLKAHPGLLAETFDAIEAAHGSLEGYFQSRLGLPVETLRAVLLEPDDPGLD